MAMYNLIECRNNYSKTSGRLWQYYKDDPNDNLADSESFKSKLKITGNTPNNRNTKNVEIIVPLKHLSNFWRTLEMPLINCEVNLILIWSKDFFDQPINSMKKTYENIRNIAAGKGDDYTTGCLLDYPYFKENYKMIAIDLSRKNELDADPKAIQQINFTANLDRAGNTTIFFITEEAKETVFEFSQGTVKAM